MNSLDGDFKSYKYFHHHREFICNLIKPSEFIKKKVNNYIKKFTKNNKKTVSLHVKRNHYNKSKNHILYKLH